MLIHAGAGGVGLAAIQICKHIGAEIFATAGNDEKREYLKSLGVDHVMNSRTLDFADEIMELTGREGIDVVLNSLPGDAIEKSLSCLRAYGRFLEIGKTDIYSNSKMGLLPFQDNLSYFAIDLDRMLRQRSDYIRGLYAELMPFFEDGTFQALPFTQFSTEETVDSFRYMAQRKNIGKVVVTMQAAKVDETAEDRPNAIRKNATYLITGGLGALGMRVARWMAAQGAGHLALMSRRSPSDAVQAEIAEIENAGTRVACIQGDVGDLDSLQAAIDQIPADFGPLSGIIHAAGVLADGVMFDMELEQLAKPLASKVARHLEPARRDTRSATRLLCNVQLGRSGPRVTGSIQLRSRQRVLGCDGRLSPGAGTHRSEHQIGAPGPNPAWLLRREGTRTYPAAA